MGAPIGNQNARRAKLFRDALMRALARVGNGEGFSAGLDKLADRLVSEALAGEGWAIQEIANRLDGKPATVIVGDEDEAPVLLRVERIIVRPNPPTADS